MKINEFLKSLGSTSQEVADSLRKMGVEGEKYNEQFCPVIKAIYQNFPNFSSGLKARAGSVPGYRCDTIYGWLHVKTTFRYEVTWDDCQTIDPICPEPVGQFITDFDNGKYPDLVGDNIETIREKTLEKLTKEELLSLGL